MAYFSLLDTSQLDLNANPMSLTDEVPVCEASIIIKEVVQTNFLGLGRKNAVKEEVSALEEELNRVNEENKKLTEKLTVVCENYNTLRSHLVDYMNKNPVGADQAQTVGKKRKAESSITTNNGGKNNNNGGNTNVNSDQSSSSDEDSLSNKKPRVREEEHVKVKTSRVYVRTEASDTSLVVKDGYQWRKYGQKVTRDNPSPRAYFKCSFAPTCPVKKKVQRSIEDQSILVATYEGEHNHSHPSRVEAASSSNLCVTLGSSPPRPPSLASSGPTITLDLTKPNTNTDSKIPNPAVSSQEFQQFLVEQMASSLTKDPSFKAAVAAAISGRFLQHNQTEKW
ncbi:probable WRKY transcription factor 40 isoform X2 [Rhododendron vialii]|uniref:probable WRKY transcription factor 40 isoform X2 n=1 Tax=Rhododendron vialii TaxID=182163 RepID=UPI00265E0E97|nr:probable WRKY transcription factor 40 isoform X2 [Rhododendron vialii]